MIVNAVLMFAIGLVSAVLHFMPAIPFPTWMDGGHGSCTTTVNGQSNPIGCYTYSWGEHATGWQSIIPVHALADVAQALIITIGVAILIKLLRIIVSMSTGGGGSS